MDRDDYKITRWQRLQDHKKEYEDNKLYCFLLKDCPELPTIIFYYGLWYTAFCFPKFTMGWWETLNALIRLSWRVPWTLPSWGADPGTTIASRFPTIWVLDNWFVVGIIRYALVSSFLNWVPFLIALIRSSWGVPWSLPITGSRTRDYHRVLFPHYWCIVYYGSWETLIALIRLSWGVPWSLPITGSRTKDYHRVLFPHYWYIV